MNSSKDPSFWQILAGWVNANWWIVLLILAGAWVTHKFGGSVLKLVIRQSVKHKNSEDDTKKRQDTLISLSDATLRVMVWLVAGFSIIKLVFPMLDLTPLFAGAGVLGVALGFGSQTVIKDFLSGLFIILENQYRVGDVVTLDNATGTVEEISIRSTILRDNNGNVHHIPNGTITHTINKTMGFSKVYLSVEVSPTADVDKLAKIINSIGEEMMREDKWNARIIETPHFLGIDTFSSSTLVITIVGKTQPNAQWSVTGELRKRLLNAFKKEGIIAVKIPESKK